MERRSRKVSSSLTGHMGMHTLQVPQACGHGAATVTGRLFTVSPPVWDLITIRVRPAGWEDEYIPLCLQPVWITLALQSQFLGLWRRGEPGWGLGLPWCGHLEREPLRFYAGPRRWGNG